MMLSGARCSRRLMSTTLKREFCPALCANSVRARRFPTTESALFNGRPASFHSSAVTPSPTPDKSQLPPKPSTGSGWNRTLASASIPHPGDGEYDTGDEPYPYSNPPHTMNPIPDFNDSKIGFDTKSNAQLLRALVSFSLCQVPVLVRHSELMLNLSRRLLGNWVTDSLMKATLFGHFCAGEDEKRIQPAIKDLEKAGVGSILDYAAEDDGSAAKKPKDAADAPRARVYDYESEAICDRHVLTFKKCIQDVANLQSDGFAACKVTALGNPELLKVMSNAIVEAKNLFRKFDQNNNGFITRGEFERGFNLFFKNEDIKLKDMIEQLQPEPDGMIDYITWSMLLTPHDLPQITAGCREVGPLTMAAPTLQEVELIEKMYDRGHALAREAAKLGTRLLVDAEQVRFQPAIDNLVLDLQRTYNCTRETDQPIIYNTYQCYLKDAPERLRDDIERSERFDYHFGAKLVRGAYMVSERDLAETLGCPSPIHDTEAETHDCYNNSVEFLLQHAVKSNKKIELMLATHNQESIEQAINVMNELGIDRTDPTICFAQLFGMMDHLTFNLGKHGYRAYKYVPYGEVKMVMPYLIRRANENSSIEGGAGREMSMIVSELRRRMLPSSLA